LYNILIEFGIPVKLLRLTNMCLTETCMRGRVDKHLSDMFSNKTGLKQDTFITPAFQLCSRICHKVGSSKPGWL